MISIDVSFVEPYLPLGVMEPGRRAVETHLLADHVRRSVVEPVVAYCTNLDQDQLVLYLENSYCNTKATSSYVTESCEVTYRVFPGSISDEEAGSERCCVFSLFVQEMESIGVLLCALL